MKARDLTYRVHKYMPYLRVFHFVLHNLSFQFLKEFDLEAIYILNICKYGLNLLGIE